MEKDLNILRVCQIKAKGNSRNFKYSISRILNNIYNAFKSLKITTKEKLEIKNLIFTKSSEIANILEDLKKPDLFNNHLKTLKKIIKRKTQTETEEKSSNKFIIINPANKTSSIKYNSNKKFLNLSKSTNKVLNQSLLMDSNESIIFIENTNQNLFSEQEDENLTTTLGLELFNQSTNPSTPLNARKIINNKNDNNFPIKNFKESYESRTNKIQENYISKTSNNIIKNKNFTDKILNDKN
jgi:hypothetical protein